MASSVQLRDDYDAGSLRDLAKRSRDPRQIRRFLALAAVYDGMKRADAAKVGGMDRQTLRGAQRGASHGTPLQCGRSGGPEGPSACRPATTAQRRSDGGAGRDRRDRPGSSDGRGRALAADRSQAGHREALWRDLQRACGLRSACQALLLLPQWPAAASAPRSARTRRV